MRLPGLEQARRKRGKTQIPIEVKLKAARALTEFVELWLRNQRLPPITADDFDRLTPVRTLADAAGCLSVFEAAPVDEGVDAASLAIYLALIGDAVKRARGEGRGLMA